MIKKIFGDTYDILRGVNTTIWDGVEGTKKVGKVVKMGISGADVLIGTSHALKDFGCNENEMVCGTIDVVRSVSSAVGLVLDNIPATKHLTFVTGSVTVECRSVRYYCKKYGTFWGCTTASGQGVK